MNYYERHLGDYAKDTAHLTILEHGAYTLLLDRYYSTEAGIPSDQVHRVARARSREEKAAVDAVLEEFFVLVEGIWTNRRSEEEISKFNEAAPDRQAKKDNDRERQRRARERRKYLFEQLRAVGIVPQWDAKTSDLESMLSRSVVTPVTPPVTRDNTANQPQSPDTSINTGIHGGTDQKNSVCVLPHTQISDEFRTAIRSRPELDADLVFANFVDHYPSEKRTLAKWKQWVKNERGPVPNGEGAPSVNDPDSRASIETLGRSVGIGKWDQLKEPWAAYKTRVLAYREAA